MQDEDVQLTDQFLAALGALLKKHNRPVPFAIPELQPQTETGEFFFIHKFGVDF